MNGQFNNLYPFTYSSLLSRSLFFVLTVETGITENVSRLPVVR